MLVTPAAIKATYTAIFRADTLPTVAELVRATDLSPETVEQAVQILKGKGLVEENQICVDHFAAKA